MWWESTAGAGNDSLAVDAGSAPLAVFERPTSAPPTFLLAPSSAARPAPSAAAFLDSVGNTEAASRPSTSSRSKYCSSLQPQTMQMPSRSRVNDVHSSGGGVQGALTRRSSGRRLCPAPGDPHKRHRLAVRVHDDS